MAIWLYFSPSLYLALLVVLSSLPSLFSCLSFLSSLFLVLLFLFWLPFIPFVVLSRLCSPSRAFFLVWSFLCSLSCSFFDRLVIQLTMPHMLSGPISRDIAIVSLRYPSWCLLLHRHISAIPHFATYRAILVRYPRKTSTKTFCDTIAQSIARYDKYRYWAS